MIQATLASRNLSHASHGSSGRSRRHRPRRTVGGSGLARADMTRLKANLDACFKSKECRLAAVKQPAQGSGVERPPGG